jgi:A/G-specific adenine glycosylase
MDVRISAAERFFTKKLLLWNSRDNYREMPWKGEKDPYKIWLSEIILQQTRVEQGLEYYNRFITTFPTVHKLAKAPQQAVFKLWEGLGYYTRCKNLIASAVYISKELKGTFPEAYEDIIKLKGVGPYTAAAIASFAFNQPHAVVDGNVYRVLSRFFGIATPVDSTEGKKEFTLLAQQLLDKKQPGVYNQALMDFGATVCKPSQPACTTCSLQQQCLAFSGNLISELPVKTKKIVKKNRWLYYLLINFQNKLYVRKRAAGDIWENLNEFVLVENDGPLTTAQLVKKPVFATAFNHSAYTIQHTSQLYKQQLTHQTIQGRFICISVAKPPYLPGYEPVTEKKLLKLAFPKFITHYLTDKKLTLNL